MIRIVPYSLQFAFTARTSRNVMNDKPCWFVLATDPEGKTHLGECAPIFGLSEEKREDVEAALQTLSTFSWNDFLHSSSFQHLSSVQMALEMIRRSYQNNHASVGTSIPINGLVWMNDVPGMLREMREKVEAGFRVIKLKIGAEQFEEELSLLRTLRSDYAEKELTIRLDANGAFSPKEAPYKLEQLAAFGVHSIEQPIAAGQWKEMRSLCEQHIIPIALDEELIGHHSSEQKQALLQAIQPQYIILKPSLHGAFSGCDEWIRLATDESIAWWATSALESSAGLDSIATWACSYLPELPQGLGTGSIYTNNLQAAWRVENGRLIKQMDVDFTSFFA